MRARSKLSKKYLINLAAETVSESDIRISCASPKTATMLSGWLTAATNLAMMSWTLVRIDKPTCFSHLSFDRHARPSLASRQLITCSRKLHRSGLSRLDSFVLDD